MAAQLFVERFVVVVGNIQSLGQESRYDSKVKDLKVFQIQLCLQKKKKLYLIVFINRLKKMIRSVFAYQVPRDDLVYKQRHHIWYSRIYWGAWLFVLIIQNVFSSVDLAIQIKLVFPKCTVGDWLPTLLVSVYQSSMITVCILLSIGSNCVHLCLVVKHCYLAPTFLVFNYSHWFKDPTISDGDSYGNLWLRQWL